MRTAFYFDEDSAYPEPFTNPPDVAILSAVASHIPVQRRHVYILRGTLSASTLAANRERALTMTEYLLGIETPAWTTFTPPQLLESITTKMIAAFVLQGLQARDSRAIHASLEDQPGYLGAIQVHPGEFAWLLYDSHLPDVYRVIGDELRLFYREYEVIALGDERDHAGFRSWEERQIFAKVSWEDLGGQGTIFDPYANSEYARIAGESETLVSEQLARVVDEIRLGFSRFDPQLVHQLHGALKAFDTLNNADSLAQVSLSCRRLMERLADAIYPPREGKVNGRKVGQAEYRNRLWAYISHQIDSKSQREVMIATLTDVGKRVDAIDAVANKGLHADLKTPEVERLLISLLALVYDILTVAPPPTMAPQNRYSEVVDKRAGRMLRGEPLD